MRKMIKESNEKYLVTVKDPSSAFRFECTNKRIRESNRRKTIIVNIPKKEYDFHFKGADDNGWKRDVNKVLVTYQGKGQFVTLTLIDDNGVKLSNTRKKFKINDNSLIITDNDKKDIVIGTIEESDNIDEAYNCQAQMMNIRNQLMNKLGDEFTVTGGTTVPKIIVASSQRPSISFEITPNGQNVDITPRIDNIPDTLHKKKSIAYMRAGNILYDFIMDTLKSLKVESVRKLYIREEYVDDYLDMFAVVRRMIDNMAKTEFDPPLKVDFREYSDDGWYAIVKIWRSDYPELKREYELKYKDAYDGILYVHTQEGNKWDIYYSQKDFIDWLFDDISWRLY